MSVDEHKSVFSNTHLFFNNSLKLYVLIFLIFIIDTVAVLNIHTLDVFCHLFFNNGLKLN